MNIDGIKRTKSDRSMKILGTRLDVVVSGGRKMRTFDRILCPTDFSEKSVKGLQWAEYLARKYDAEVMVLHVMEFYPVGLMGGDAGTDYDRYQASVYSNLTEFVSPLKVRHEKMMSSGNPAQKIAALASGLGAGV